MTTTDRAQSFNQAVALWLKNARMQAQMSIEDAAALIALSKEDFEDIESGKNSIAGQDFYVLVSAYEVPAHEVNDFLRSFGLQATL